MNTQGKLRVSRYDLGTPMMPCKDEILAKFEKFLVSGQYILGHEVQQLEKELAAECGVAEAVGVASGSSALFLALAMAGVRPGDEVITTPYTFEATIEALILLDATPVLVDIQPTDLNIDLKKIEAAITDKTRAILPVHIFGAPCDMHGIEALAAEHGLEVVVDMAQAFGTMYDGKPCASFGRMNTLSFYPTKNLPGIGDGGMVFCRDAEDADRIRKIRGHQAVRMNGHLYCGWNSRLDEVQAMVIRIRHSRFAAEQKDRDEVGRIYDSFIPRANRLVMPNGCRGMRVTHHQYWVRAEDRKGLQSLLSTQGIDTGVYYDPPMNRHDLAEYCRIFGPLDEAERAGREILVLPIHAALPFDDARRIGEMVGKFLARSATSANS
ncbi:MAG: DegT/DnrJ/EryC1/StrS family aminotransferase [Gemmatimonadales bacterium]|nr:DegT/DnrJ/EryC1/StrS family aminotransferase [Gemmatimonadales bacterium]